MQSVNYQNSAYFLKAGKEPATPQEIFVYFILEREAVRLKKESGADPPWSDDPILNNNYFTNVDREDDRVTRWIRQNLSKYRKSSNYELVMMMCRIINRVETLAALEIGKRICGDGHLKLKEPFKFFGPVDSNPPSVYSWLDKVRKTVSPFWGSAYVVSTNGHAMDKLEYYTARFEEAYRFGIHNVRGLLTLRDAYDTLKQIDGLGSFLAAQVVADLKNTPGYPFHYSHPNCPDDWYTFSAWGKGSLRGLRWFHEQATPVLPSQYDSLIESCSDYTYEQLDELATNSASWAAHCQDKRLEPQVMSPYLQSGVSPFDHPRVLCRQNLQNCLCEFDKYMRVRTGAGRSKRNYFQVKNPPCNPSST